MGGSPFEGFNSPPKARGGAYTFKGKFKFCLILDKLSDEKYTLEGTWLRWYAVQIALHLKRQENGRSPYLFLGVLSPSVSEISDKSFHCGNTNKYWNKAGKIEYDAQDNGVQAPNLYAVYRLCHEGIYEWLNADRAENKGD